MSHECSVKFESEGSGDQQGLDSVKSRQRMVCLRDSRYIDYENTAGFQSAGYDATGAVTGFGWKSIWVVAAGMAYRATDCLALRCGYSFNTSPISDCLLYNSPSPRARQKSRMPAYA